MKTDGTGLDLGDRSPSDVVRPQASTLLPRIRLSRGVYRRRRSVVALTLITLVSAPWLRQTTDAADAATTAVSVSATPVRAAGALAGPAIVRVNAGTPRTVPSTVEARPSTALELLANSRLTLSESARADLAAGTVDSRVIAVLARILMKHRVEVSTLITGHGRFVRGTTKVSNHVGGRAADIVSVDGQDVSSSSSATRALMDELFSFPESVRPTEIGGPWDLDGSDGVGFTDSGHATHVHLGYDD